MTLGEDLVLLAVNPRDGRIRNVERIAPALRALQLIELSLAGRVAVRQGKIAVEDHSPVGHRLLDRALDSLAAQGRPSTVETWLRGSPTEPGALSQYLTLLGGQQVIRIERHGHGLARYTRIIVRDQERCSRVRARIDAVAHGQFSASDEDRALAGIVHACGLGRRLYRGPHHLAARRRLARCTDDRELAETMRSATAAGDAEMAAAVAEALSDGLAKVTKDLTVVLRQQYRLEHFSSDAYGGHHHGAADMPHSGHHHPGSGDVGGGHHHG